MVKSPEKTGGAKASHRAPGIAAALLAALVTSLIDLAAYALRNPEEVPHMGYKVSGLWVSILILGAICFFGRLAVKGWSRAVLLLAATVSLLSFTLFPPARVGYMFPPEGQWISNVVHFVFVTVAMVCFGSILTLVLEREFESRVAER